VASGTDGDDEAAMFLDEAPLLSEEERRRALRGEEASTADGAGEAASPPRIAVAAIQRDEARLLDPWLRYHAALFGAASLTLIDAGSADPAVRARLEQAEAEGVRVLREPAAATASPVAQRALVAEALRAMEPDHDILMPLACAEFVAVQGLSGRVDCTAEPVLRELAGLRDQAAGLFVTRGSYLNLPGMPGFYVFKAERRCFFRSGCVGDLSEGFHAAKARAGAGEKRTGIVHFHYRVPPYAALDQAARRRLDQPARVLEAQGLRGMQAGPPKQGGFGAMDEAAYLRFFRRFDRVPLAPLRRALRALGSDLPG
jgi:hypothetical protein